MIKTFDTTLCCVIIQQHSEELGINAHLKKVLLYTKIKTDKLSNNIFSCSILETSFLVLVTASTVSVLLIIARMGYF